MPRYPGGQTLDYGQSYQLIIGAGGTPDEADLLARIAGPESGYYTRNVNENVSTGDNSWGLWQINMLGRMGDDRLRQWGLSSKQDLWDPATNARAALDLLHSQGTGAWTNTARQLGIPVTSHGVPSGYVGSSGGGGAVPVGFPSPGDIVSGVAGFVDQFNPFSIATDFATSVGRDIIQGLFRLAVFGTLLAAGGTLIALGAWRSVSPQTRQTVTSAAATAGKAAAA